MVIGLTGGIGCGKSAAAACFARRGFQVIDADALAREVLTSPACVDQLVRRWGQACLTGEGSPDRAWIAAKVFAEPAERAFLESITHPEVARRRSLAVADRSRHHVVEIPLLFEKNLAAEFDAVVCVSSSEPVRFLRLELRGLSPSAARARMDSQDPLAEKVMKSDYVLFNDGDLDFLDAQVAALVDRLRPKL
jgi:dephospho-CoA kinase